jgi:RNA recognition motif-containing protein
VEEGREWKWEEERWERGKEGDKDGDTTTSKYRSGLVICPQYGVYQVKILRSTERVDTDGVGRSMGYGFVEFSNHDAALSALRFTNNNPAIFGKTKV